MTKQPCSLLWSFPRTMDIIRALACWPWGLHSPFNLLTPGRVPSPDPLPLPMSLSDCPNSHLKVLPTHNLVSLQFINGIGSVVIFLNHGCKIVSLPVKNTSVLLMALKNQVCASLPPLLPPSLPLPFPLLLPSLHGSRGLTLFIISSFATLLMPS